MKIWLTLGFLSADSSFQQMLYHASIFFLVSRRYLVIVSSFILLSFRIYAYKTIYFLLVCLENVTALFIVLLCLELGTDAYFSVRYIFE